MDREEHELSFSVEPSFQNKRVPMGVETQKVAKELIGYDGRAPDDRSCCCPVEVGGQGKNQRRDF